MGWLSDKAAKWRRIIDDHGGDGRAVTAGWQSLTSDLEVLARWSEEAQGRLALQVPDPAARREIMRQRSCVFTEEFGDGDILALRALYQASGDIETVLRSMRDNPDRFGQPFLENGAIIEVRRPRDPAAYAKATDAYQRQLAACYCPLIRAARKRMPLEYCCCSAGWYRGIYQGIFGRPVDVVVEASLLNGDDHCRFSIRFAAAGL